MVPRSLSGEGQSAAAKSNKSVDTYTGVVIIHGIGDEKRNETLEEALNALTYWFNHVAGLALRPKGPGRVWLRTALTISNDPDAPASHATLELEPPRAEDAASGYTEPLRIEMREVWWAQTFGLPSVGSALRWARVQFWEEWLRVLLPVGRHSGPARAAERTPARAIPQAVTYRPLSGAVGQQPGVPTGLGSTAAPQAPRGRQWALRAVLALYGFIQYFWKSLQWILLAPLVYLLLALVTAAKLLAIIPFVQTAVLKGLSALVDNVSLHWIAPMQVYLQDYARSSTIRQLFEREVAAFLQDERCDRIVVLAHSMGTVIAYEGLATVLTTQPEQHQKPITFVSLGQALRRMWLLTGTDVHRLRIALPRTVRWINIWAHYDPVSAGPLNASALPLIQEWLDPDVTNPHEAICAKLDECENVDVVNNDSLFTDHTSYWQNMEQVVGPVALELVAGHPALARLATARQAAPDTILTRRWNVAWRAMFALAAGATAAGVLLLINVTTSFQLGTRIRHLLDTIDLGTLTADVFGPIGTYVSSLFQRLHFQTSTSGPAVAQPNPIVDGILAGLAILAVLALVRALIERYVTEPSPLGRQARVGAVRGTWGIFVLTLLLLPLAVFLLATNVGVALQNVTVAVVIGIAWLLALSEARHRQQWGWFIVILIGPVLIVPSVINYTSQAITLPWNGGWEVVLPITGALTLAVFVHALRRGRWLLFLVMLFTLWVAVLIAPLFMPIAPALVYGLLVGPNSIREEPTHDHRTSLLALLSVGVVLLIIDIAVVSSVADVSQSPAVIVISVLGTASVLTVMAGWIVGMVHMESRGRWVWVVAVVLVSVLSSLGSYSNMATACYHTPGCTHAQTSVAGLVWALAFGLAPGMLGGVLTYALVAGPPRRRKPAAAAQPAMMQPAGASVRRA